MNEGWVDKYKNLSFWDAYEEDEKNWIVSNIAFNGMFRINIDTGTSQFICGFRGEIADKGLHKQIIQCGEYIFFIPELAHNVIAWNSNSGEMRYMSTKMPTSIDGETKVSLALEFHDKLWLFPQFLSQNILVIDLKSLHISEITEVRDYVTNLHISMETIIFDKPIQNNEFVWIPVKNTGIIIQFNMDNRSIKSFSLSSKKTRINCVSLINNHFWITLMNEPNILEWDPISTREIVHRINIEWSQNVPPFSYIVGLENEKYMILPAHAEEILVFHNEKVVPIKYPTGFIWINDFKNKWSRITSFKKIRNQIYLFPVVGNMLLIYDIVEDKLDGIECTVPFDWNNEYIYNNIVEIEKSKKVIRDGKGIIHEDKNFSVSDFLYYQTVNN